jgi:hypothetical protein
VLLAESAASKNAGREDNSDKRLTQAITTRHLKGRIYFNAIIKAEARPNLPEVKPGAG